MSRVPSNDVVRAGLVGEVHNPPVFAIANDRPIVAVRIVSLAHERQNESDIEGFAYAGVFFQAGLAHGLHQLVQVVVADRGPHASDGDLADGQVVWCSRNPQHGGHDHARIEDDQRCGQRLGVVLGLALATVLAPFEYLFGGGCRTPLLVLQSPPHLLANLINGSEG